MKSTTLVRLAAVACGMCAAWLHAQATLTTAPPKDPFALPARAAPDLNIPGNDLESRAEEFPSDCKKRCDAASWCKAWTWVRAGAPGQRAMCFLKTGVSTPVRDSCCVSGFPGALGEPPKVKLHLQPTSPPVRDATADAAPVPKPRPPKPPGGSGAFACGQILAEGSTLRTHHADAAFVRNVEGTFTPIGIREGGNGAMSFEAVMTFAHVSPPMREQVRGSWKGDQFILWRSAAGQRWRGHCVDHVIRGQWTVQNQPEQGGPFLLSR